MTKQEEIREELAKRRYYDGMVGVGSGIPSWEDRTGVERDYFRAKIDDDFQYLHSQGVVIKAHVGADLNKCAIVVVEPLIKETV